MAVFVQPTGITLLATQLPHQRLHPTRIHPLIFPSTTTPPHQILSHGRTKISSPIIKSRNQDGLTFLDDDDEGGGGVDEFDGYLNDLSLEYDSVWDTKPSWKAATIATPPDSSFQASINSSGA
ncbi:hypothetical protein AKJ16_DCAP08600 [Drosera capensis]